MKKIIPRGKQILIKVKKDDSHESESGLIIPTNVEREQKAIGKVISVGPDIKDIKKDDEVIYGAYAGEHIKMKEGKEEVEYILLFDEDVLAFLK